MHNALYLVHNRTIWVDGNVTGLLQFLFGGFADGYGKRIVGVIRGGGHGWFFIAGYPERLQSVLATDFRGLLLLVIVKIMLFDPLDILHEILLGKAVFFER